MSPILKEGQDVLSINWFINPKVGDIVVVKRLQAEGTFGRTGYREIVKRIEKIEGDQIWIMGDNQDESTDSRDFGPVKMENIIGKVVYTSNQIPCLSCSSPVIGIYGRKDAICQNCGFKLICCGE